MKKIISGLVIIIISLFGCLATTKALQFHQADFIPGEYLIIKRKQGLQSYTTFRYIEDDQNRKIFCVEPSKIVNSDKEYTIYENLSEYPSLTEEQVTRISLILHYGYGYKDRTDSKWYVITQFMIWQTVEPDTDFYFTDTLHGNRIEKYTDEMASIENEIAKHNSIPSFAHDYKVNYKDSFELPELNSDYEIISTNQPSSNNDYYKIDELTDDITITFRRKDINSYNEKTAIYDSPDSQDVIVPGNIEYPTYTINVNIKKSFAVIELFKYDNVYTIESDFANTCYEVYQDDQIYGSFCTDKDTSYQTVPLPYGTYYVRQTSHGIGYEDDQDIHSFTIDELNTEPHLCIITYLIKNNININKSYCKKDDCQSEANAIFRVYDKNNNVIDDITTDEFGHASIQLGYGTYKVEQITPQEFTLNSVNGTISNNGDSFTCELNQNYHIDFINQYTKKSYFHSYGRVINNVLSMMGVV